ncbi:hypothetical protein DRO30_04560 [Candidatus Bathyarchaeota archaeon]|nr:MAG: hypothetical protein DRO30_04560 [Candidatus Bathyarchaeota archaeon]
MIYDDKYVNGLRRLTKAVKKYDAKLGLQLLHAGRYPTPYIVKYGSPEPEEKAIKKLLGES